MKVMVTGSSGQLGSDLVPELKKHNIEVIPADIDTVDITDKSALEEFINKTEPDGVIHLAAYTAVDKAESEKELCTKINALGTENLAEICGKKNIKILYISTDYIFGGTGDEFIETDAPVNPCNHYGLTKLQGEESVKKYCSKYFIVRISWVFGVHGKNFVYTMLRLAESKDEITVVSDQIGSPTFTEDLSSLLCDIIKSDKYGTYHATNEGVCSWAEFAKEIMTLSGKSTKITPIKSDEYPTAAKRPFNSRLSKKSLDAAGFGRLPHWKDALTRFLKETGNLV